VSPQLAVESAPGAIGRITLGAKQAGKRSAGNPHAPFDEAGAGNVAMVELWTHRSIEREWLETLYLLRARQFPTLPPRIHGELLMLGIEVAESTVGRYMVRRHRPPSQGWKTFLRNHAAGISLDLFVVRTISFKLLYGLVILRHARRRLVTIKVTSNPTAEWIAGQVTDAFPWDEAPRYLIRDRDGAFGPAYTGRIRAMRIRDHPIAARSPWQNGHVERLIGSIRRESLDHLIVFDEAQLRRALKNYAAYYNQIRTHLSLGKNAPEFRCPQKLGPIASISILGGLHNLVCPGLGFD
jgi:transposase InsO family protein